MTAFPDRTVYALSTAPQRAALAVIRVSGDKVSEIAGKMFSKDISSAPAGVYHGFIVDGERKIDEVVLTLFRAPRSFTGEDTVEISCHGGAAVISAISGLLAKNGAVPARNGEFTQRAFLNGKLDLTQAEAVIDIIDAETGEEAENALKNLGGAVSAEIKKIREPLVALSAKLFALIDYPDDEIGDTEHSEIISAVRTALETAKKLADTYSHGRLMKNGIKTVIAGKPNVGKSSLFNALAGRERSIVTEIAGTTRDVVEDTVILGGMKLVLTDTAGMHETDDRVESIGVRKAGEELEAADLVICVFDGSGEYTAEDEALINRVGSLRAAKIAVVNKKDLGIKLRCAEGGFGRVIEVSAKTGEGVGEIEDYIKNEFVFSAPEDTGIITGARQYNALCRASESLAHALENSGMTPDALLSDIEEAINALGELTGETASESILSEIFSRFCVGK